MPKHVIAKEILYSIWLHCIAIAAFGYWYWMPKDHQSLISKRFMIINAKIAILATFIFVYTVKLASARASTE